MSGAVARMLAEMRELGWDADADAWEDVVAEAEDFHDVLTLKADIRAELREMRRRAGESA